MTRIRERQTDPIAARTRCTSTHGTHIVIHARSTAKQRLRMVAFKVSLRAVVTNPAGANPLPLVRDLNCAYRKSGKDRRPVLDCVVAEFRLLCSEVHVRIKGFLNLMVGESKPAFRQGFEMLVKIVPIETSFFQFLVNHFAEFVLERLSIVFDAPGIVMHQPGWMKADTFHEARKMRLHADLLDTVQVGLFREDENLMEK